MNSIDRIGKIGGIVFSWATGVCAVLTVAWIFVMVIYIVGRRFGLGWLFVEEFTGYWLVIVAYIPLAYSLVTGVHITVDLVTRKLPEKTRSALKVFTDSIGLVLVGYLLWRSIGWVIRGIEYNLHSDSSFHIVLWPTYLPIPIGLFLFGLALMVQLTKGVAELTKVEV